MTENTMDLPPAELSVSFKTTREEFDTIAQIAERAESLGWRIDRTHTLMDLSACHANGCPLDLAGLLHASEFDLFHDLGGIYRHLDRTTGRLTDHFLPRYHRKAPK